MRDEDKKLIAEIESQEAWLSQLMADHPEPECRNIEHAKLQVRIAAAEAELSLGDFPEPDEALFASVKQAVRADLASAPVEQSRPQTSWRMPNLFLAPLAAAALLALLVLPNVWMNPNQDASNTTIAAIDRWNDLEAVLAVAPDVDLLTVEGTLDELEAEMDDPEPVWGDSEYEALDDEIDRLFAETEAEFEV